MENRTRATASASAHRVPLALLQQLLSRLHAQRVQQVELLVQVLRSTAQAGLSQLVEPLRAVMSGI
jgi:hypothetical protein